MNAGHPLGLPSSQIAAFSGKDEGPAHLVFRSFFVAESRKFRAMMHKTSGDISAGYEKKAKICAKFAVQHHQLARIEVGNRKFGKASERNLPADERHVVTQAVRR
jgi:hypothetical protein